MDELIKGDLTRITEVKAMLKSGKRPTEVKKALQSMGYNDYHIAFMLEKATGDQYIPGKPIILQDTRAFRYAMIGGAAVAVLISLAVIYLWMSG